jgi:hypothetical protein
VCVCACLLYEHLLYFVLSRAKFPLTSQHVSKKKHRSVSLLAGTKTKSNKKIQQ